MKKYSKAKTTAGKKSPAKKKPQNNATSYNKKTAYHTDPVKKKKNKRNPRFLNM